MRLQWILLGVWLGSGSISGFIDASNGGPSSSTTSPQFYVQQLGKPRISVAVMGWTMDTLKEAVAKKFELHTDFDLLTEDGESVPPDDLEAGVIKPGVTLYVVETKKGSMLQSPPQPPAPMPPSKGVPTPLSTVPKLQPSLMRIAAKGLTIAALVTAVAGYTKLKEYRDTKRRLAKKYKLGNLTRLQHKTWLTVLLASYGAPRYLYALIANNVGSVADFVGSDPRAIAELYYGHEPTRGEVNLFLRRFFPSKAMGMSVS